MMLPYGQAPSDMGGCTGLALQVAQALAIQMEGNLAVMPAVTGMQIVLCLPFRVCNEGDSMLLKAHPRSVSPVGDSGGGCGGTGQHEDLPASILPPVPPVEMLTERMFEWLVNNSDDAVRASAQPFHHSAHPSSQFVICAVESSATPGRVVCPAACAIHL